MPTNETIIAILPPEIVKATETLRDFSEKHNLLISINGKRVHGENQFAVRIVETTIQSVGDGVYNFVLMPSGAWVDPDNADFICTKCGRYNTNAEPENCNMGNCFVQNARASTGQEARE